MTTTKKLWIGIVILTLLSPLGLIIPALFGAGGAWGEWGLEEIKKLIGYAPQGMEKQGELWKAPLADYTVPGQAKGLFGESVGYVLTAVLGIALTAGVMYFFARMLARKNGGK
jgi:cobalt/nickel transport protein